MNASDIVIDVKGLNKSFAGKRVVQDFSIQVKRGQIFGFLGPNGSGKTTTIRMLCGLLTPDSGSGTCLGFDILTQAAEIKRQVGYMTQRFSLYEDMSISENLDFIARMYAVPDRKQAVDKSLLRLGLQERRDQLAGTLSGGWKQRLALAACLLHEPKLLLLDEPTAGVDPKARRDFWQEIHQLAAQGLSVLVSTHYMDEAERCHELTYIAYGKLLAQGTVEEVVRQARLTTYIVEGDDLVGLAAKLRDLPGVEQAVPFGNTLHVSGTDSKALNKSLKPFRDMPGYRWTPAQANLEDVFISLMDSAKDSLDA
jgi:ABC-2 type transport system ATP-binding protein